MAFGESLGDFTFKGQISFCFEQSVPTIRKNVLGNRNGLFVVLNVSV